MDFISREHERNFKELKLRFHSNDVEYNSACYITAVPMIFDKVSSYILGEADSPVVWIYAWEERCLPQYQYEDEFDHEFEQRKDEEPFQVILTAIKIRNGCYK